MFGNIMGALLIGFVTGLIFFGLVGIGWRKEK